MASGLDHCVGRLGMVCAAHLAQTSHTKAAIAAGLIPPGTGELSVGKRRAQWAYSCLLLTICIAIGFLPCPGGIRAPGIVGYGDPTTVRTVGEGRIAESLGWATDKTFKSATL